jgi:hypothetical protein
MAFWSDRTLREKVLFILLVVVALMASCATVLSAEMPKTSDLPSHDFSFAPCAARDDLKTWLDAESRHGAAWAPMGLRGNIKAIQELAGDVCARAPNSKKSLTEDHPQWFSEVDGLISSLTTQLAEFLGKPLNKGEQQRVSTLAVVLRDFQQNFSATRSLAYASVPKGEQRLSSTCSVAEANDSQ